MLSPKSFDQRIQVRSNLLSTFCFDDPAVYRRARDSDALSRETIKRLYHVENDDIVVLMFFEPALAWKCTLKRPWEQGSYGERDTFGAQQHAPLLSIVIP